MQIKTKGNLFICATPIGNLGDVTVRALEVLRGTEIIVCEDTRRTLKLLNHYGIKPGRLISYHHHSNIKKKDELLELLERGRDLVLVSDAGMPGVSDPGADIISMAREKGFKVTVLPGASAVTAALAVSGCAADRFVFLGFLDRLPVKQRKIILSEKYGKDDTIVLFVSPHKIAGTLQELHDWFGFCEVVLIRELTKKFEEVRSGTPADHLNYFSRTDPRGEFTLVIKPANNKEEDEITDSFLRDKLHELKSAGIPPKYCVKAVSHLLGVPRNRVYKIQLETDEEK